MCWSSHRRNTYNDPMSECNAYQNKMNDVSTHLENQTMVYSTVQYNTVQYSPSVRPFVHSTVRPPHRPYVRPSISPSDCPLDRPCVRPFVCPSVRPSVRPTNCYLMRPLAKKLVEIDLVSQVCVLGTGLTGAVSRHSSPAIGTPEWYPVAGIPHLVSRIWYPATGIPRLVSCHCFPETVYRVHAASTGVAFQIFLGFLVSRICYQDLISKKYDKISIRF